MNLFKMFRRGTRSAAPGKWARECQQRFVDDQTRATNSAANAAASSRAYTPDVSPPERPKHSVKHWI